MSEVLAIADNVRYDVRNLSDEQLEEVKANFSTAATGTYGLPIGSNTYKIVKVSVRRKGADKPFTSFIHLENGQYSYIGGEMGLKVVDLAKQVPFSANITVILPKGEIGTNIKTGLPEVVQLPTITSFELVGVADTNSQPDAKQQGKAKKEENAFV